MNHNEACGSCTHEIFASKGVVSVTKGVARLAVTHPHAPLIKVNKERPGSNQKLIS